MIDRRQLHGHVLALGGDDAAARRQALQALRDRDEREWADAPAEALLPLVDALGGQLHYDPKQASHQKEAAAVLGNLGPHAAPAVPQLVALLRDGVPDHVREAAAAALGKIGKGAAAAVDRLVELVVGSRPVLSLRAVRALGNIGRADAQVRSALVGFWLGQHPAEAKAEAAVALCQLRIPAPGLLESLTRALVASQDLGLRKSAAEALAWCDKDALGVVPALLAAGLGDKSEEVRRVAQAGLDRMGLSHEDAALLCAGQLGDCPYAEAALRRCGRVAVPALVKALAARGGGARVRAARALGSMGPAAAEAAPAFAGALGDRDPEVRLAAAKGLWNVTGAADLAVPALVDLLKVKTASNLGEGGRRVFLQTVMEALARIGPPAREAVPALAALAEDENRHVRETALAALTRIEAAK